VDGWRSHRVVSGTIYEVSNKGAALRHALGHHGIGQSSGYSSLDVTMHPWAETPSRHRGQPSENSQIEGFYDHHHEQNIHARGINLRNAKNQ
jgi:hypothetical protein